METILDQDMLKKGILQFKTLNNSYILCIFLFLKLNSFQNFGIENLLKFILFSNIQKEYIAFQQTKTLPQKFLFNENFIENLKSKIHANISIFHEAKGSFFPIYKTKKLINSNCLKLVFTDNNTFCLIIRSFDLEKPFSIYCEKCLKSYSRKSILTHNCIVKKCLVCFQERCEPNFDETKLKQVCPQCFKMSNSDECFEKHKELTKTECKLTSQCQNCFKTYRGTMHQCQTKFCKGCFSFHTGIFCTLSRVVLPKKFLNYFICLTFSNFLFMVCDLDSFVCIFNRQISRQMFYVLGQNSDLILKETITCFKLDFHHIMHKLKIKGQKQKFFCDEDFFSYISRNIDCKFKFKKGQLTECVDTLGLFCKIESFINIHPILIWHKIENESFNPLYLKETAKMNKTKNCKSFKFEDFLNELYFNDQDLFSKLYKYNNSNNVLDIQQCSYLNFGINNLNHRLRLYKIAFVALKSNFISLSESQKIMYKSNFQCLDFSSLAAIGKFFWDNSLLQQNLPILPCDLDNSIKNSSKVEICFVKAFLKTHTCNVKFIKSFISNDGKQFSIDRLSSDLVSFY